MKKILFTSMVIAAVAAISAGCSNEILDVESKTSPTSDYLYTSAEGLQKAVVGLYDMDRSTVVGENAISLPILLDACTDIEIYQGGLTASLYRLEGNTASTSYFATYWKSYYKLIGKANEIIAAAKELGLDDPEVGQVFGEASALRARAYFLLYQKYERLYLNIEPTTVDNAFDRTFRAAGKKEIFDLLKYDLDNAIEYLDWTPQTGSTGNPEYGRMTKAIAKHIRAQVAMWESDWDTAIAQCESIFNEGAAYYQLLPAPATAFTGADLNCKENLYVFQFSNEPGGGNSVSSSGDVVGHRISLYTTPRYDKVKGMTFSADNGGYGWGRVFPNTYLLSLYDKEKDTRYSTLFKFKWYYNNAATLPSGKKLGDEATCTKDQYLNYMHPQNLKYFDQWTNADLPSRTSSFKDVVIYRLGETAMIGCEAYFHKEGSSAKALEWYNKTWTRAGNEAKTVITMEDILEEYARECNFEGVRWPLLKRLGILGERVRLHSGDTKKEDTMLPSDYIHPRKNFTDTRDYCWPIPQTELDLMPGFGQNQGW